MTKDEIIEDYRGAYQEFHGRDPVIESKHGWYRIDRSYTSYRLKDLKMMAGNIRFRLSHK